MKTIRINHRFTQFVDLYTVLERQANLCLLEGAPSAGGSKFYAIGQIFVHDGSEDVSVLPGEYSHHSSIIEGGQRVPLTLEEMKVKFDSLVVEEARKHSAMEKQRQLQQQKEKEAEEMSIAASKLSSEQRLARIAIAKQSRDVALDELRSLLNVDEDLVKLSGSKRLLSAIGEATKWQAILSNLKS